MKGSIRRRLAASYALVVLVTVVLMGGLSLWLVRRHVERQEREFLRANAEAVARQAAEFLAPQVRWRALAELAGASAFLGNARVRVLAEDGEVIADSGDPAGTDEFLWLVPSTLAEIESELGVAVPIIVPVPAPGGSATDRSLDLSRVLRNLPLGTSRLYIRRTFTPWGRQFTFGAEPGGRPGQAERVMPRTVLTVAVPVAAAGRHLGTVELSSPLSFRRETLEALGVAMAVSGVGALLAAAAVAVAMGRAITSPLGGLAAASRRMAGGDLSARAPDGRDDEFGQLARQFNGMAESLEVSFRALGAERDSLRRFVADASHELRTPITALATFAELLEGPAAGDEAARREFLRESRALLGKLAWIVENLLDLSRLDAGIAVLVIEEQDAGDLAASAAAPHLAAAARKGVAVEVRRPAEPLSLACDRQRVELALGNLVGNAVKFSPPGARVEVIVEPAIAAVAPAGSGPPAAVRFTVADRGPGIEADELPRIFERFFRGRHAGAEGAGLGLAITQSVAVAHGGSVRVDSAPGEGCRFHLELPVRPPVTDPSSQRPAAG